MKEISGDSVHALADIVQAREELSLQWVQAYAIGVTQDNVVPGHLCFAKPDPTLEPIGDILRQFSGSAK